jgi:hypothetical protein
MSLNYLLSSKKMYENILNNLNNIMENYENMLSNCVEQYGCFHEEIDLYFMNNKQNIQKINELKMNISENLFLCEKQLQQMQLLCEHKFVNDSIDITLDNSKNIRYCEICEFTENE